MKKYNSSFHFYLAVKILKTWILRGFFQSFSALILWNAAFYLPSILRIISCNSFSDMPFVRCIE